MTRTAIPNERAGDLNAAREAALKLLERMRRTRADLARRLKDKGYDPAVAAQALDRLAGVGLIDDTEYARAYLAGRWGRRPAGWRRLEQELRAKGVDAEDIERARALLVEQVGEVDEVAAARRVVEQADRRARGLDPHVRRRRLYALLGRRGFGPDTINAALDPRGAPVPDADSGDSPDPDEEMQ